MMTSREIWKNPIDIFNMSHSHIDIMVPEGSEVLHVSRQYPGEDALPHIWTIGDPTKPLEPLRVHVFGTGIPIFDGPENGRTTLKHIGTEIFHRGQLVMHFFINGAENE